MTDPQNCMTVQPTPKKVEDTFFGAVSDAEGEMDVTEKFVCDECGWEGKNKRALTAHHNFSHTTKKETKT